VNSELATGPPIREAGDSALLLALEPVIDPDVNARAIGIAAALRSERLAGVRDIVPAYRSVAVMFDPLRADVAAIAKAMRRAYDTAASADERPPIDLPIVYGGDAGPDLDAVAAFAGCTASEVIARHSSPTYRVFMVGFLPGFAYLGTVDESIAAPRRPTPRLRVAAGSVGIAGRQTGIYPFDSPGGWQIIGRTNATLFDASRTPPSMFAPGDRVRFVPDDVRLPSASRAPSGAGLHGLRNPCITILKPGLFTTIQDEGRWGCQDVGVPVSGPMDQAAHRLANLLVGNDREAATLEATLMGPEMLVEQETVLAVTGADLSAAIDGAEVTRGTAITCPLGGVLRFGPRRAGARAYVSFSGGIASPVALGSRSTHVVSRMGGIDGRALRAGDRVPLGSPAASRNAVRRSRTASPVATPGPGARLRVLPGPHDDYFAPGALDSLQRTRFTVTPQSDRMGYRLSSNGEARLNASGTMISDVTFMGGLQVPPSGDPILLMADRQTTGGYPQIVTVITADLPAAGQLAPGDWVEFELCSRADAIAALIAQEGRLLAFS
jgi:KipI family sensor histidine kinase inhibitor